MDQGYAIQISQVQKRTPHNGWRGSATGCLVGGIELETGDTAAAGFGKLPGVLRLPPHNFRVQANIDHSGLNVIHPTFDVQGNGGLRRADCEIDDAGDAAESGCHRSREEIVRRSRSGNGQIHVGMSIDHAGEYQHAAGVDDTVPGQVMPEGGDRLPVNSDIEFLRGQRTHHRTAAND